MKNFLLSILFISFILSDSLEIPKINSNDDIISHFYYTLSYNEQHEQADWVAYKLTRNMIENGSYKRTDDFRPDFKIKSGSSQLSDYKSSGYDRGHLCPAGDMKNSLIGMSESFLMSNISPQNPSFNRGIWKSLEGTVRTWAVNNEEIYIVTGPVLNDIIGKIGSNAVSVPKYFYKVILDYNQPEVKAIGFIIENKKGESTLSSYAVSVDDVEKMTGIDFFHQLSDEVENKVESSFSVDKWSWKKTNSKKNIKNKSENFFDIKSNKLSLSNRCTSNTKKGTRCKRNTFCSNYKCSSHGGNCY